MDIDNQISDVLQWQSTIESISKERDALLIDNEAMKDAIANLRSSVRDIQQENAALKDSQNTLQDSFLRRYDYKEECQRLKEEIRRGEVDWESERKNLMEKIHDLEALIGGMRTEHSDKVDDLHEKRNVEISNLKATLLDEISRWREKGDEEARRCEEVYRLKESEIMKIKMDYDGKIKRLQEQHIRLQNKTSTSATGNDIFRKKLQHERDISAKKFREFEAEVEELKRKLAAKDTSQSFISGYTRHITNTARPVAPSIRKRKQT